LPIKAHLNKVLGIIKNDAELALYFYDELNSKWVELLDEGGEFDGLGEKETGMIGKYKAHYLKHCAETQAEAVLRIIGKIEVQDVNIQGTLIGAIVLMPEETAVNGVELLTTYLDEQERKFWHGIGKVGAELMVKLVARHPDEAFEIAEVLLDAWVSEEKTYGKEIIAKFSKDEYSKLMLEHYSKVWEESPERAIKVLVKILTQCLETLDEDGKDEEAYDASKSFGYGLELGDLNEIDMKHPSIRTVLVKGICEAGKVLIDKNHARVSELFDQLEGTNRAIFLRIAMYLLRFVKAGTESARIGRLIGNKDHFKEYNPCWHEHRRLLNDKFEDVTGDVKRAFLEWIEEDKYSKQKREELRELTKENDKESLDFEDWENRAKAEELYLVRERFKDEYERYKNAAGVKNDSSLAPRKSVSDARWVDPKEGTPLSAEDMANMNCEEVLDYLLKPENYEEKERVRGWGTAKDALAETFKYDAKKRMENYLDCNSEKLLSLGPHFMSRLFYGLREEEKSIDEARTLLAKALDLASEVVIKSGRDKQYDMCFSAILSALRDGFSNKADEGIEFTDERIKRFWSIIETLAAYPIGNINRSGEHERDPVQIGCNLVPGQAMELSVSLGAVCKKRYLKLHEEWLRDRTRKCYETVLSEIDSPGVKYVFGMEFARIYWTDREWVEKSLENLFSSNNWDEVWGTYVSWGRPSAESFKLLLQEGQYLQAVNKIGKKNEFRFRKESEVGLVEHLMVGYFNGWIGYGHKVLQEFFGKAPAELRAEAARFMTTGFKGTREDDDEKYRQEVAQRMSGYWRKRIEVIKERREIGGEEAVELTGWVCDSVLPAKETLEILVESLVLSDGKIGKRGDARDFVESVTKLGEGNEMLALQCMMLASGDEEIHVTWSSIQEPLVNFLGKMVDMPKEIQSVAIEVADMYGRYSPNEYRGIWEKLSESKSQSEG